MGGDYNISKLKLIKTIHNDCVLNELILLNDGRPCTYDVEGKVKIYDLDNFNPNIIIKPEEKIKNIDWSKEAYHLCCNEENNIIFTTKGFINIAEIVNSNKYKIIQKIKNNFAQYLFTYENYIIAANFYKPQPPNECLYVYSKNEGEYKLVHKKFPFNCAFYFEKIHFKEWEMIFYNCNDRIFFNLCIKKNNMNQYKDFSFYEISPYFHKQQMIFFEPSYIIVGE